MHRCCRAVAPHGNGSDDPSCRGSFSPGGITDACADAVDPLNGGIHANLYNNLWGTAFPQWYDDDGVARFQIHA